MNIFIQSIVSIFHSTISSIGGIINNNNYQNYNNSSITQIHKLSHKLYLVNFSKILNMQHFHSTSHLFIKDN